MMFAGNCEAFALFHFGNYLLNYKKQRFDYDKSLDINSVLLLSDLRIQVPGLNLTSCWTFFHLAVLNCVLLV